MRRRRQQFIPIFLIALVVQVLAPIAASWAAAIAASDPLVAAEICHANPGGSALPGDPGVDHCAGLCSICCAAQASAALDAPQPIPVVIFHRDPQPALWRDGAMEQPAARAGSIAQARAPPQLA